MSAKNKATVLYASINGKFYPMVYSYGAKAQIAQNAKMLIGLQQAKETVENGGEIEKLQNGAEVIGVITTLAEILIKQGCTYMNTFRRDYKPRENSAVNSKGSWVPISREHIEAGIFDDEEFKALASKIIQLISNGSGTIRTKTKSKNLQATLRK